MGYTSSFLLGVEGKESIVLDACVHPDVLTRAQEDPALKLYLAQLAGLWACEKFGFVLTNQGKCNVSDQVCVCVCRVGLSWSDPIDNPLSSWDANH